MNPRTVSSALLALVLLSACGTPRESVTRTPDVGERAPALDLPTASGERFSLEAARRDGSVVVVFYRGLF